MKNLRFLTLFFLLIGAIEAAAVGVYQFSPLARNAYDKTLSLRFNEAEALLAQLKRTEPNNLIATYIENYIDCLRIFVSEEKWVFDKLAPNEARRLKVLKTGDPNSPYHLFTQAQVKLCWAMNRAKFGEYLTAFNAASAAFELLEQNQKKFPSFMPNKMSLGVLHAIVGVIPDNYKWGVKVISGMNGTVQQGQAEIAEVIKYAKNNDFVFEQEAIVIYAFLMLHLGNDNEGAWYTVNNGKLKPRENPLACFALASVAMRTGRNDRAIELLQNKPSGAAFFPFPYLDYMLGSAKLFRGDADADYAIKLFVYSFKGRNYIKEAFQRLAWHELMRGNSQGYYTFLYNCKTQGRTEVGGDKNAQKEALSGIAPDWFLLRARLYFDGGYYQKAYDVLKNKKDSDFAQFVHKLEFYYRMGRNLQMLKNTNEAIKFYDLAIKSGKNTKYYYACNAALQMGLIYEQYGQWAKAREYFNFCLQLNPDDYADSLHAKAKAGLARLRQK